MNKRVLIIVLALFMGMFNATASAISKSDLQSLNSDGDYYWPAQKLNGACGQANGASASDASLVGNTNFQKIFNFFVSNGYTKEQAAGIIGNISKEDGTANPSLEQGGKVVNIPSDPDNASVGYGIVQWTPARKLMNYADSVHQPVNSLSTQLNFLLAQLNGTWTADSEKQAGDQLKTTTTADEAAAAFMGTKGTQSHPYTGPYAGQFVGYERPLDEQGNIVGRIASARAALALYGSGAPAPNAGDVTSAPISASACSCSTGVAPTTSTGKTTIVLDPGHSPKQSQPSIDTATNIVTSDYENDPEMQQMYDAAQVIATKLRADGYTVIITKKSLNDYVDLKQRADIANQAQAALGISMHGSPGAPSVQNTIFYPKVGEYRYTADGQKAPAYANQKLADADKSYSETMAAARQAAEGQPVRSGSYGDIFGMRTIKDKPPLMQKGNVLTTQYFATVPWVYSEKAEDSSAGISPDNLQKYENGIVAGAEKIVPKSGVAPAGGVTTPVALATGAGGCSSAGAVAGSAVQTAINYAWPDYHPAPYLVYKDSYRAAITKAQAAGEFVGGLNNPGVDCGGFITRVMRDSGADPNYNWGPRNPKEGGTTAQKAYMDAHPEKYQNLGPQTEITGLQPGDIAINDGHTFMWVGKQPNFNGVTASASVSFKGNRPDASWRTPMASSIYWRDDNGAFIWYRLKS